ncbi:ABC transporter permease [Asanoa iriomotensis]|uniref:Iron ABC transporter permease n=1 Tax=Asanoa iriomotensis TaxID=234613 RepID=A0ABQ4C3S3_9ACTN|nr:iron ABC transporter permease [Asanoa iriomotensis]GIF57405.1 iron ABC transporter permease [Asanoa iriomotensis]
MTETLQQLPPVGPTEPGEPPRIGPDPARWRRVRIGSGMLRNLLRPSNLIVLVCVLLVAYFVLVPLLYLLYGTFYDGRTITFRFFEEAYSAVGLTEMWRNTLMYAIGSTVLSVTIGTTLAYLTVRTDIPFKGLIFATALIPLVVPGILNTIAWIFLLSPRIGIINSWLEPIFGAGAINIYSIGGMIFVEGLGSTPLVFLLMYAAFRSMDPALEESALMSGASLWRTVRTVTLPLVRPALYTCALIMLVSGLESFEVPALLGIPVNEWVLTSRIWEALGHFPPRTGEAGAIATTLLVIAAAGVLWQSRLQRKSRAFQTVSGKGFRPRPMELGKAKPFVLTGLLLYFAIAVVLPLLTLIYASLQPYYQVPSRASLSALTLDNYRDLVSDGPSVNAIVNSFSLSLTAATCVMFLVAVVAWVVIRTNLFGRNILDSLTFLPLMIPGLVLGVSLLYVYLRFPLPIYATWWILLIAYFTKSIPIGMRYASASMYQIGGELEESANTSGATWWQTFRWVTLPLLFPGLLGGWIYLVVGLIRELSASLLLYSPGNEVISVRIWEMWSDGSFTEIAAFGMVMVGVLMVLVLIARKLGANIGVGLK